MTAVATIVRTASRAPVAAVPDSDEPVVSFVTVTYGTGPVVIDMIAGLVALCDLPFEVIAVDHAHPRRPGRSRALLLARTAGVRLVDPAANLGFGGGCNLGARHARGRLLALVNPDLAPQPGWLGPLVDVLEGDPGVGIAAATLLDPDGSVQECGQMLYADGTTAPRRVIPDGGAPFDVDHASAACWLMRTVEFLGVGGFDPAFHPAYFEDVDLALRVRAAGQRIVAVPASRVVHATGTGTPDPPRPAFEQLATLRRLHPELAGRYTRPPAG